MPNFAKVQHHVAQQLPDIRGLVDHVTEQPWNFYETKGAAVRHKPDDPTLQMPEAPGEAAPKEMLFPAHDVLQRPGACERQGTSRLQDHCCESFLSPRITPLHGCHELQGPMRTTPCRCQKFQRAPSRTRCRPPTMTFSQRPGASEALEETKRNAKLTTEAASHGPHNESRTSAVSSRLSRMPSLPAPISQPLLLGFFTLCP